MIAYLGGSAFQTIVDNPVTAYRQLVQQYAKGLDGKAVDPAIARAEANAVFKNAPVSASLSGLVPRLIGVGFKRIPKFGILLGVSYFLEEGGNVGYTAATAASIFSAPFINPIRMIEKQQRAFYKTTGVEKPIKEILKEVRRTFRVSGFKFSRQEKEPLSNLFFIVLIALCFAPQFLTGRFAELQASLPRNYPPHGPLARLRHHWPRRPAAAPEVDQGAARHISRRLKARNLRHRSD